MTNTNSYDCSYDEKPVLEGIMDILRFMDGWTKKVPDRDIKVIQSGGRLLFRGAKNAVAVGKTQSFFRKDDFIGRS